MKWLLNILTKIHWPYISKKIDEYDYDWATYRLKEGDLIFSTRRGFLTNLFNPSKYKHVGVYVNGKVIEATLDGVVATSLAYFMYTKDEIQIRRLLNLLPLTLDNLPRQVK